MSIIHCAPNTVRSEHWHRTDFHYLHVAVGRMEYQCRPVGAAEWPEPTIVRAGESVFTPAELEHRTAFPVYTMLVSCSRLGRDHETHEADLVRVK